MASCYIQLGPTQFWPTFRFRQNTQRKDGDIAADPGILLERELYERRAHLQIAEQSERIDYDDT
jgi:hypothetical protein